MEIKVNDMINSIFLVKAAEIKNTKTGSRYLDMRLCDKDTEYSAKLWGYPKDDLQFEPMTLQRIIGKAESYSGNIQIKVSTVLPVDASKVDISDFIPTAPIDSEFMLEQIYKAIDDFKSPDLKRLTYFVIEQNEDKFKCFPAAVSCHDAVRSGLLHHTYKMLRSAQAIHEIYPAINLDLLSAGIILHDIAKTKEIDATELGIGSKYTVEGNLIGHLVLGAMEIERVGNEMGVDKEIVMLLEHMLISHHGKPEYGAAKVPMVLEAQVLSMLDDLDAKIFEFTEAVEAIEPGELSQKIFPLGNVMIYKHNI